jgi:hypothetical protein
MSRCTLSSFLAVKLEEGQEEFARIIRALTSRANPELLHSLNVSDDAIFLEPLLFAYFNTSSSRVSLDQILYGYIDDDLKPPSIEVFADEDGITYLPNVGYFETKLRNRSLELIWDRDHRLYQFAVEQTPVEFSFKPIRVVEGTSIELCQFRPPLLGHLFGDAVSNSEIEERLVSEKQIHGLNRAIQIVAKRYPFYFEHILKVTRKILVYNSRRPYSFASVSAHGMAFLNAHNRDDEIVFLEDIVHQCGHIIFSAMTLEKQEYFQVDPETPLSEFTHANEDETSVYGAFHGLFTQANINRCLLDCYQNSEFSGRQLHELLGRLSDDMKRFKSALYLLAHREIYTELGWLLFHEFKQLFEKLERESHALVNSFDTSNQPYIFDYDKFQKLNPLAEMEDILMRTTSGVKLDKSHMKLGDPIAFE